MKKVFLIMFLFTSIFIIGQEKIANKTYLYGDLKNSVQGKVLVYYGFNDPKGEEKALEIFKKNNFDVVSWNKLFMPGQKYTDVEMVDKVNSYDIKTIVFIKNAGTSSYTQSSLTSNYDYSLNSTYTYGSSSSVVGSVDLLFEIYNAGVDKPVAVIKSSGKNNWGIAGTQRGVSLDIVDKVVNTIVKLN